MALPGTEQAGRRTLDRHGKDATLRNYTTTESDGRETPTTTGSSPHTVTARVARTRMASPDRGLRETGEPTAEATILIRDDASGTGSLRDGGGEAASEIDVDGETYVVVRSDDQDNGLLALECERVS